MNKIKLIATCICGALIMVGLTQGKGWRSIVPLHSTRTDVTQLLGPSPDANDLRSNYHLEKEDIYIVFSTKGFCDADTQKVPLGTVLLIQISPKTETQLADYKIDETRFRRFNPSSPPNAGYQGYVDADAGVIFRTYQGRVDKIAYIAAAKDKHLCPAYYENPEKFMNILVEGHISKFDEYSDIPCEDERARLDNFAIYLQNDKPEFKGYIIVYAGPSARSGEAQARAKRAKDHLVKVRGIEAARLVTIDGGCRDRSEVELYALPATMSPPTPNPYRHE